jgi:hypothetical protein
MIVTTRFAVFPAGERHIDRARMNSAGIQIEYVRFRPPVYPQLWGDLVYNLSAADLLMNCGPRSIEILSRSGGNSLSQ